MKESTKEVIRTTLNVALALILYIFLLFNTPKPFAYKEESFFTFLSFLYEILLVFLSYKFFHFLLNIKKTKKTAEIKQKPFIFLKTKYFYVGLGVIIILILLILSWGNAAPLKFFPRSSLAARLSGYEGKLATYYDYSYGISLGNNKKIYVENYFERWYPGAIKGFPDGGMAYQIFNKIDIYAVEAGQNILWQNVYVNMVKDNYNIKKTQIDEAKVYELSDHPEVKIFGAVAEDLARPGNYSVVIYKCSDSIYQFVSRYQYSELNSWLGPRRKDLQGGSGIEINIDNGDVSIMPQVENHCTEKLREQGSAESLPLGSFYSVRQAILEAE